MRIPGDGDQRCGFRGMVINDSRTIVIAIPG